MIRLGIIIVFLLLFFFAFRWFYRNVVTPNLHDHHMKQIDRENVELDNQLDRITKRDSVFRQHNDESKGE